MSTKARAQGSYDATVKWFRDRPTSAAPAALVPMLIISAGAGCEEDLAPPDAQSEFVDLYLGDGIEICAGQLEAYDRFIPRVFDAYTGEPPGDDFYVSVHALADAGCGRTLSCADKDAAWLGHDLAQYHEITHVVQWAEDGRSIPSLEEGTATAFGPLAPITYAAADLEDVEADSLIVDDPEDLDYGHAAVFTRFLIERYGVDRYREFFRAMAAVGQDYRGTFESTFGESLDAIWPAFVSAPRCTYDFWPCDRRNPITLPYELNGIDCDDSEALGYDGSALDLLPTENPYRPATLLHLDNAEARTVTFELEYVRIYLGGCGDCTSQQPSMLLGSTDDPDFPPIRFDLELSAGTTVLFVRSRPGGTPRVSITEAT